MEIGKIEKPEAGRFFEKRKIYCVNHIFFSAKDEELKKMLDRYWTEIDEHLRKLEVAGKIKKIFIEGLTSQDEETISSIREINENLYNLLRKRIDEGGRVIPIEEESTFSAFVDLRNCLYIVRTKEVYERIYTYYREIAERRFSSLKKAILDSLNEGESALLIMDENVRSYLDLPEEIELFLVVPPTYDEILRYLRRK